MVNWLEFENLPGSAEYNFEILCRSIIWMQFGRFGTFKALANQPGIEFDLNLDAECVLGSPSQWFGWQCRWYNLSSGRAIGTTRRKKIVEALEKTADSKPDITDWVLWTRHPLTKSDQDWYFSLKTKFNLHLWTSHNVEALLSGDAEILKQTYFGDLILTPERLSKLHDESVAPIKRRWLPDVHQAVDVERELRRMLGHPASWAELKEVAVRLDIECATLKNELASIPSHFVSITSLFIDNLSTLSKLLKDVDGLLKKGELVSLTQLLEERQKKVISDIAAIPRKLRGARLRCGLHATNALADLRIGNDLLTEISAFFETRQVAVIADAGSGKTQLSASLSANTENRPAGILLFGRNLRSGQTLDDLAKRVVINGKPVLSMQALLAALNAAGDRSKCRLPLIIDGLNEAEDPRDWKPLLASLDSSLKEFANVLVVCTLRTGARSHPENGKQYNFQGNKRPSFADQALPDGVWQFEMADFANDTLDAIRKYFSFFRITLDVIDSLTFKFLSHPLTLRIFCEVTNPDRNQDVGMEAVPRSLAAMFELYINRAAQRIEELSSHSSRYFRQDVLMALDTIGQLLWKNNSRELGEQDLRKELQDERKQWNNSLVTLMEQEGILLRMPGERLGMESVIPVYDLLGGYLIASTLVTQFGSIGLGSWLKEESTSNAFGSDYSLRHPLSQDIFRTLVSLAPRKLHLQIWPLVEEPLRTKALQLATLLEGKYLDSNTVDAIATNILENNQNSSRFLDRLFGLRSSINHPLNANFLDTVLRKFSVDQRDLLWSEWMRENEKSFIKDIEDCIVKWKKNTDTRSITDSLMAQWIVWSLTTTIHRLRDMATLALYWFGRGNGAALFDLTEKSADINDPYVFERTMAASYGVAMALSTDYTHRSFRTETLPIYARRFFDILFKEQAPCRTTHTLIREYGRRFVELAVVFNPTLFSADELSQIEPPFSNGGQIEWGRIRWNKRDPKRAESPFRMDFENYTIGRLVKGRRNYDYENKDYKKIRNQILWRISGLGWTASKFSEIDRNIENSRYHYNRRDEEENKTDRYGKKYSWIAYFELGGWLQDKGLIKPYREDDGRTWDIDIDPSFPKTTVACRLVSTDLLGDPDIQLHEWIENGECPELSPYFKQEEINGELGPWVALDGYVSQQDEKRKRSQFAFIRSFFVASSEKENLISFLRKQPLKGRWLPEKSEFYYTFSGEIPWCKMFAETAETQLVFVTGESTIKVQEEREDFFLDGKPIKLSYSDLKQLSGLDLDLLVALDSHEKNLPKEELSRVEYKKVLVEVDRVVHETKTFDVVQPVCDMRTPGRLLSETSKSGFALIKNLAELLELCNIPQTYDLQTKHGKRATIQIANTIDTFKNSERFFFIREDLLRNVLDQLGMSLVWAVWGERQLSLKQLSNFGHTYERAGKSYGHFQAIYSMSET